jgi:hypothetical protein
MRVRETFYRGEESARRRSAMPARTYNLTRILLSRTGDGFVFIPIRAMQTLAIVEPAEFNFVHSENRPEIQISWQNFAAGERSSLDQPVPYDIVYYTADAPAAMQRLQGEFGRALELMASRCAPADTGVVLELRRR